MGDAFSLSPLSCLGLIHSTSSQSRHFRVYLQKFAIGIPPLLSDCCCGLACCRFGHRKGQSSNCLRFFFIRMSPAFTKFKWWELFVINAWETHYLDTKLMFHLHVTAINKLNEVVIVGSQKICAFSRICSFKTFPRKG